MDFSSRAKTFCQSTFKLTGVLFVAFACAAAQAQSDRSENKPEGKSDVRGAYEAAMAVAEPAERVAALERFVTSHPNSEEAGAAREEVVRGLAALGEVQLAEQSVGPALNYFKRAVAALPLQVGDKFFDEVAARIPLAVSVRGYRDEAVALAREMEVRFLGDARKLTSLGEFYLTVEDAGDALRVLRIAAKLAPNDARLRRTLGAAYRLNLKLDEAAQEYRAAIKLEPEDKRAHYELANLERGRGAYTEAVKLYRRQLEIEPQHAGALKGLALARLAEGKDAEAAEALKQAAAAGGADVKRDLQLQTQLAFTYVSRGQLALARSAAEAALTVEPRFSWARLAAAEVDLAEGKYFEAERHLLAALSYADFPTIHFTLGRIYLTVEDFDGALEQFAKAFRYSAGRFRSKLGGVLELEGESLAPLIARERQAAIFKAEPTATEIEFQMIEALARMDAGLRADKPASGLVSSLALLQSVSKLNAAELERAVNDFVEAESSRRPFRALYAAQRLVKAGQMAERALKLAEEALEAAETATAPEGSVRDYPNYDRDGRLQIFRGRAGELKGWALQRLGRHAEASAALVAAVEAYGSLPERKRALWRLAAVNEAAGREREALDLYLAAYEPPDKQSPSADLNRAVIEALYRKLNGSLDGLDERIGRAEVQPAALIAFGPREQTAPDAGPPTAEQPAAPTPEKEAPGREAAAPEKEPSTAEVADKRTHAADGEATARPTTEAATNAGAEAAVLTLPASLPPVRIESRAGPPSESGLWLEALNFAGAEIDEPPAPPAGAGAAAEKLIVEGVVNAGSPASESAVELPAAPPSPTWSERAAPFVTRSEGDPFSPTDALSTAPSDVGEEAPNPADIPLKTAPKAASRAREAAAKPVPSAARDQQRAAKLPVEVAKRAAAIGLSSGNVSRTLAREIEPPAASATNEPAVTEPSVGGDAQAETPANTRPRRVSDTAPTEPEDKPATRRRRVVSRR
jgi:tetratricopeptide (TPR) repeat protein